MRKNTILNAKRDVFTKDGFIRLALIQCKLKSKAAHPHQLIKQIQAIRTWSICEQKMNLFIQKVVDFSFKMKQSKELLLCLIEISHLISNSDSVKIMTILHLIVKNRKYMQPTQVQAYLVRGLNLMSKQIMNFGYIGFQFCLQFCFMTQNHNGFQIIMQRTINILQVWVNQKFSQYFNDIADCSLGVKTQFYIFSLFTLYKIGSMKFSTIQEQKQYHCRIDNLSELLHKLGKKYKTKEIRNYLQHPIFKQKVIKLKKYTEHNCNLIKYVPNVEPIRFEEKKQNKLQGQKIDKRIRMVKKVKKNENKIEGNNSHKLNMDHQVISHNIQATINQEGENDNNYNINVKPMQTSGDQIIDQLSSLNQELTNPAKSLDQSEQLYEELSNIYLSELNCQLSNLQFAQMSQKQTKSAQKYENNGSYSSILSNKWLFSNPQSVNKLSDEVQQEQEAVNQQQFATDMIEQLIQQQIYHDINYILGKQSQSMHTNHTIQYCGCKQDLVNRSYIPYFKMRIQNDNTSINIFYYLKYTHHYIIAVFLYATQPCLQHYLTIDQIQSCLKSGRFCVIPFHALQSLSVIKDQIIHQPNYYIPSSHNNADIGPSFRIYGVWVQAIQGTMKVMQNFGTKISIMYTVYEVCYESHAVDIMIAIGSVPSCTNSTNRVSTRKRLSQYGREQSETILGHMKINGINSERRKNIFGNIEQIIGYNMQISKNKLIIKQNINYEDIIPILL